MTKINIQVQDPPQLSEEPLINKSYLLDGRFFTVVKEDGAKLTAQCKNCPKIIQGQKLSTGNFLSHIQVTIYTLYYYTRIILILNAINIPNGN